MLHDTRSAPGRKRNAKWTDLISVDPDQRGFDKVDETIEVFSGAVLGVREVSVQHSVMVSQHYIIREDLTRLMARWKPQGLSSWFCGRCTHKIIFGMKFDTIFAHQHLVVAMAHIARFQKFPDAQFMTLLAMPVQSHVTRIRSHISTLSHPQCKSQTITIHHEAVLS